jgi:hypothetical protein
LGPVPYGAGLFLFGLIPISATPIKGIGTSANGLSRGHREKMSFRWGGKITRVLIQVEFAAASFFEFLVLRKESIGLNS